MADREASSSSSDQDVPTQRFENISTGGSARVHAGNVYSGDTYNFYQGIDGDRPGNHSGQEGKIRNKVPFMVPYHISQSFVGREQQLSRIMHSLSGQTKHSRLALYGFCGIGKTRIALEIADQHRKKDIAVFWLFAGSEERLQQDFLNIADEIEIPGWNPERPLADQLQLIQRQLASDMMQPWLLIIDNADEKSSLWSSSDPFIDNLPRTSNGSILLTTRNHEVAYDFSPDHCERISELTIAESKALLSKKITDSTEASRGDLANLLYNLPLALIQAASNIVRRGSTVARYIEDYEESDIHKFELLAEEFYDDTRDSRTKFSMASTVQTLFEHINEYYPIAVCKLILMSNFAPRSVPKTLLKWVSGENDRDFYKAMGPLQSFSLVSKRSEPLILRGNKVDLYDLHPLVHIIAKGWLKSRSGIAHKEHWTLQALTSLERNLPSKFNPRFLNPYIPHSRAIVEANWKIKKETNKSTPSGITDQLQLDESSACLQNPMIGEKIAKLLEVLAKLLYELEDFIAAAGMQRKALAILEALAGPDSCSFLLAKASLAQYVAEIGMKIEAKHICEAALRSQQRIFGAASTDALRTLNILGEITRITDKTNRAHAEKLFREVLQNYTLDNFSQNELFFDATKNLISILIKQSKFEEAGKLCEDTLQQQPRESQLEKVGAMKMIYFQAYISEKQDLKLEALSQYNKTLELSLEIFGHKSTMEIYIKGLTIPRLLWGLKRHKKAESMCKDALSISTEILGPTASLTMRVNETLGSCYRMQNKNGDATKIYKHILTVQEDMLGRDYALPYATMHRISREFYKMEMYKEAEKFCREALKWRQEHLSNEDPDVVASKELLEKLESRKRKTWFKRR